MKTALVTGGAKGIGEGIVRMLANAGYLVVLQYFKSETQAMVLQNEYSNNVLAIRADITQEAEVVALFTQVKEKIGHIEVLVNNAGISMSGLFQDTTNIEMHQVFEVNFFGTCHCIQRALPDMITAKAGRIINISSIWGQIGASCESVYAASKAAIHGLTQSLSKELAPCNITVNAIAPGAIRTDMLAMYTKAELAALTDEIRLQRLGTPADIANTVLYLLSEDAAYITGQIISVNGGLYI